VYTKQYVESITNQTDDEKQKDEIELRDELIATNEKRLASSIVFIAAFKHLKSESLKFLKKKKIRNILDNEIQWIITVPAIWSDSAKHKMRKWAIASGLIDENVSNQCKIVYEPDCASLAIQHYIKAKNKTNSTEQFKIGEKYMLISTLYQIFGVHLVETKL